MKHTLMLLSALALMCACNNGNNNDINLDAVFDSCCSRQAVEYRFEGSYVYVPNVFLINLSANEKVFRPFVTSDVSRIDTLTITQELDSNSLVLFSLGNTSLSDFSTNSWDGSHANSSEIYEGLFYYSMIMVNADGNSFPVRGTGCAVLCSEDNADFLRKRNCFFPSQFDTDSMQFLSNAEIVEDCFYISKTQLTYY